MGDSLPSRVSNKEMPGGVVVRSQDRARARTVLHPRRSSGNRNQEGVCSWGVKQYKPTSAGRRFQTVSDFAEITCTKPEKSLLAPLPKKAGRNNKGRITTRHQGGGVKRRYRIIDFKRQQGRHPRQGRDHRVRPEPFRPYRSSPLRRWREALHPPPEGPEGRRHG